MCLLCLTFPLGACYGKGMTKQRMKITSHRNNVIGRLQAHDPDTGATVYEVDGPYRGGRYRVLGLRLHGYLGAPYYVYSLAAARATMRMDAAASSR